MFFESYFFKTKESTLFTFLVAFMAWGNVYQLPGLSQLGVGEILFFLCMPLYFRKDLSVHIEKYIVGFILYFVYLFLLSLVMLNYFGAPLARLISIARVLFYWSIIFYFGQNLFNQVLFKRLVYIFTISLSIYIILQFTLFTFGGFYLSGFIPGLPLNQGGESGIETMQRYMTTASYLGFLRPNGFLLEPAHCVQTLFVGILWAINDADIDKKKKYVFIIIVFSAVLFTQSSTGIILMIYASFSLIVCDIKHLWFKLLLCLIVILVGCVALTKGITFDSWALDRIFNIASDSEIDGSSNVRLNNGLRMFNEFPFTMQIFGSGIGFFDYLSVNLGLRNAVNYMNAFSFVLFSAGFLGMAIWLASFGYLFVLSSKLGRNFIVGFFIMSLGCSIFCQPIMVWFFLIIFAETRSRNCGCTSLKLQ